jgi:hypothetical protein
MTTLQLGVGISSNFSHTENTHQEGVSLCCEKERGCEKGRDAAVYHIVKHRAPLDAGKKAKKGRAGSPSYERSTNHKRLRRWEVANLLDAFRFAQKMGLSLGAFLTIRWSLTALGEADIPRRLQALLNALRMKSAREGWDLAFLWVHENPPRDVPSFNTHLLVSSPAPYRAALEQWLLNQLDALDPKAVDVQPTVKKGWHGSGIERVKYMAKGTDKMTALKYGLISPKGWDYSQGTIPFRRCGTSRNIGRNARKRYSDNHRTAA